MELLWLPVAGGGEPRGGTLLSASPTSWEWVRPHSAPWHCRFGMGLSGLGHSGPGAARGCGPGFMVAAGPGELERVEGQ